MPRQIVLLRGINIGSRNRIAMPALREELEDAGFGDVKTYVQSGNVVLTSRAARENPGLAKGVNVVDGKVTYLPVADATGQPYAELFDTLGEAAAA